MDAGKTSWVGEQARWLRPRRRRRLAGASAPPTRYRRQPASKLQRGSGTSCSLAHYNNAGVRSGLAADLVQQREGELKQGLDRHSLQIVHTMRTGRA